MARIIYKPHCSECGAVINDEIMYKKIYLKPLNEKTRVVGDEYTNIYPMKCETCGVYFDCIEITPPTELTEGEI